MIGVRRASTAAAGPRRLLLVGCLMLGSLMAHQSSLAQDTAPEDGAASPPSLFTYPEQSPDIPWPSEAWPEGAPDPDVDAVRLEVALETAFQEPQRPDLAQTRAVVVVHRGRIVAERYKEGFSAEVRFPSWSVAKSFTNALLGFLVADGTVLLDAPIRRPEWSVESDERFRISYRHLLQMRSGLRWDEVDAPSLAGSDAAQMMYGAGRFDAAGYAATRPLEYRVGDHWEYSTGNTTLLAWSIQQELASGLDAPKVRRTKTMRFLRERLLEPLGLKHTVVEFDEAGTMLTGSSIFATARDYARFGLLYLRGGVWEGEQLLPQSWIDLARTPSDAANVDIYGGHFWLNTPGGSKPWPSLMPEGPGDAFFAQGHEGQLIAIIPSKDLVVVRLGKTSNDNWSVIGSWLTSLVAAFPDTGAASEPANSESAP